MATLDTVREEFAVALAAIRPALEGLEDYNRLNLVLAVAPVRAAIADFERRKVLIVAADEAIAKLQQDGYPALPQRTVEANAYAELRDQLETITAALAKFGTPAEATSATITAGTPEANR